MLSVAAAGELDKSSTVLRFYYIDSPPPLTVGLFFIHNHADGSYSGRLLAAFTADGCMYFVPMLHPAPGRRRCMAPMLHPGSLYAVLLLSMLWQAAA